MTDPIVFPRSLLREQNICWEFVGDVVAGGRTGVDAAPLVNTTGGPLWQATLDKVAIRTAQQQQLWQALEALADNGATPMVVPDCASRTAPWPVVNGAPQRTWGSVTFGDGSVFSDGSSFSQPTIQAELGAAASLRASSVELVTDQAGAFLGGEHFSILHGTLGWRRYRIKTVQASATANHWIVGIRPLLREACNGSEVVDFVNVRCVMRLATPDAFRLVLTRRKWGDPTVKFIETFDISL